MVNPETGKTECDRCGKELVLGEYPFCPHGFGSAIVEGDEIDVWIRNGLCNDDGSPKHYTSREQLAKDAKAKGLTNYVQHIDGSKHTTRWV